MERRNRQILTFRVTIPDTVGAIAKRQGWSKKARRTTVCLLDQMCIRHCVFLARCVLDTVSFGQGVYKTRYSVEKESNIVYFG